MSSIAIYFLYFVFSNPDNHLCFSEERGSLCTPQAPEPVCAIFSGDSCSSSTSFCQKTLDSPCLACSDPPIIAYIPGACDELLTAKTCTETGNASLNNKDEVCGYSQSKRLGGQKISAENFINGESACKQNTVDFYIQGKCQETSSLNICQKGQVIDEGCFGSSMPSCVYYTGEGCSEKLCRKTVENFCMSCADSSVLFYHEGSCEARDPQVIRELEYIPDQQEFQVKTVVSEAAEDSVIPELEAVIQQDGSVIYEKVNNSDETSVFLRHVQKNKTQVNLDLLNKRD